MITAFEIVLTIETDDTGRQVKAEVSQAETLANEWPQLPHLQPLNWMPATLTAAKATLEHDYEGLKAENEALQAKHGKPATAATSH